MSTLAQQMIAAKPGQPISAESFRRGQMQLTEIKVLLALEYVKTRVGAERIYRAECGGLKRAAVIARAIRRLDDFDKRTIPRGEASGHAVNVRRNP